MKKKIQSAIIILFFIFSSVALAGTIVGSVHDFRGYLWNESGDICKPCHTPHHTKALAAPLWNHELSTETYTMYDSPTMDANVSPQPSGMSKMCLSCHDGTVALENYGNTTNGTFFMYGEDLIGTDLRDDHPISFVYDTVLATKDGELYDPSTKLSGILGSSGTINEDMLFQSKLECSSCHDVHNTRAVPGTKLLLIDNTGSALCLTCHDK
jgi:predicted CXXCH cytochrome family protein